MKIVCALDSFKGSLTSLQAANAIKEGLGENHEVIIKPLADGGEGTVDALCECMHAKKRTIPVTGPFSEKVNATYGMTEDNTAIIEMCSAAGITLVKKEQLDPYRATTFGVGEIIQDACNHGCRKFLIGIGGSCTNDGGVGMLQALGYHFLDQNAKEVCFGAKGLKDIISIDDTYVDSRIKECSFFILSDVKNPLCGKQGACSIKEAMDTDRAYQNLKSTSKQVIRLIEKLHKYA